MSMTELKNGLEQINNIILKGSRVYYFDYPVYGNIGDILIWKGTEKFFKENKIFVKKRYSYHLINYKLSKKEKVEIPKNATIVCQGGGNFGDLYYDHQNLRKLLVKKFPDNRIVFLPQSIYYLNNDERKKDFEIFAKHPDLHIFVRDRKSLLIASEFVNNVYLCQDMAHALYPIINKKEAKLKNLHLLREDIEKVEIYNNNIKDEDFHKLDWGSLFNKFDLILLSLFNKVHNSYRINKYVPTNLISKFWYLYANYMVKKAILTFSNYNTIITSRLHGHILACLINKESILIDNSYSKNSNYYECWTHSLDNTSLLK